MSTSKDYLTALSHFWSARPQTSLEHLSKILVENPDHGDRFRFYRLWLEVVADLGDREALRRLFDHLNERSSLSEIREVEYAALRGLIALELDEVELTQMFLKSTAKGVDNVYSWELKSKYYLRFSQKKIKRLPLAVLAKASDYFAFDWQLRMDVFEEKEISPSLVTRLTKTFPNAPIIPFIQTLSALKVNDFAAALEGAQELLDLFPSNSLYRSLAAHTLVANRLPEKAVEVLEDGQTLGTEDSARDCALLGACYVEMFQGSEEEIFREKGTHFLERSIAMLENSSLSTVASRFHLSILNEDMRSDGMESKSWFLELSGREYEKISNAEYEKIDSLSLVFELAPNDGDYVFCVSPNYAYSEDKEAESTRLVAVFQVSGDVSWSPTRGYEAWCHLIGRPAMSIPFQMSKKGKPSQDSVQWEMASSDMDEIEGAVQEFEDSLTHQERRSQSSSRSLRAELERIRMSS